MTDTPDHIKAKQLQIWLAKTPMERLRQMLEDNDALYRFWSAAKRENPRQEEDADDRMHSSCSR